MIPMFSDGWKRLYPQNRKGGLSLRFDKGVHPHVRA